MDNFDVSANTLFGLSCNIMQFMEMSRIIHSNVHARQESARALWLACGYTAPYAASCSALCVLTPVHHGHQVDLMLGLIGAIMMPSASLYVNSFLANFVLPQHLVNWHAHDMKEVEK